MNIINIRQEKRAKIINSIAGQIDKKLYANEEIDYFSILNVVSLNSKCARRTAKEYLDLAIVQANAKVENNKIVELIKLGSSSSNGEEKA